MPTFGDILEVADLLKVEPVRVDEDRCVAVRNRNSKCKKCAEACIVDAITVKRNKVTIDEALCVNCGCCWTACPTTALAMAEPTRAQVDARLGSVADAHTGTVIVACSRKAAKNEANPELYAEVPCLGHIDESQLLSLAARGFDDFVLVDGDCSTCKLGAASASIDAMVDQCAALLEASASEAIVTRNSEFPPEVAAVDDRAIRGKSRRGLARQTGSYVKKVAENVARKTLDEQLGPVETAAEKRRRRIALNGKLPTFVPAANYELIDDMSRIADREGTHPSGELSSRHFGDVRIDVAECSGCGMCVLFCPHAALKYDDFDEPSDPDMRYMEFSAADCTQCMLCRDVCLRDCLDVVPTVLAEDVCDPKPQLMEMPRPRARTAITSFIRRDERD